MNFKNQGKGVQAPNHDQNHSSDNSEKAISTKTNWTLRKHNFSIANHQPKKHTHKKHNDQRMKSLRSKRRTDMGHRPPQQQGFTHTLHAPRIPQGYPQTRHESKCNTWTLRTKARVCKHQAMTRTIATYGKMWAAQHKCQSQKGQQSTQQCNLTKVQQAQWRLPMRWKNTARGLAAQFLFLNEIKAEHVPIRLKNAQGA